MQQWNDTAAQVAMASCISPADDPLHESRMYAMTFLPVHDALNTIERRYTRYTRGGVTARGASADAAERIITARSHDGSDTAMIVEDFEEGTEPGEWRFTPDRPFAFAPDWADVAPFALTGKDDYPTDLPYLLHSRAYARDFAEVKALGGDGVGTPSARTTDQTEAAQFWIESSPLQWNRIARSVARERGLDQWESARLFALLNTALADGYRATGLPGV